MLLHDNNMKANICSHEKGRVSGIEGEVSGEKSSLSLVVSQFAFLEQLRRQLQARDVHQLIFVFSLFFWLTFLFFLRLIFSLGFNFNRYFRLLFGIFLSSIFWHNLCQVDTHIIFQLICKYNNLFFLDDRIFWWFISCYWWRMDNCWWIWGRIGITHYLGLRLSLLFLRIVVAVWKMKHRNWNIVSSDW